MNLSPCVFNSESGNKGKRLVEILFNTQTVFKGKNRKIINDIKPKVIDQEQYDQIRKIAGKIALASMIHEHMPPKGHKQRDNYWMPVIGCLVRHSGWKDFEIEDFVRDICKVTNDNDEVETRIAKINYFRESLKDIEKAKQVPGFSSLAMNLGWTKTVDGKEVGEKHKTGHWFNFINPKYENNNTPIRSVKLGKFIEMDLPKPTYLAYPICTEGSITQIFGQEGKGKTLLTSALALSISQGLDFLKYKNHSNKKMPVLIVDAEMPEEELQDRYCTIMQGLEAKEIDYDLINIASLGLQLNNCFDLLNFELGQNRLELRLEQLAKEYAQKPIVVLDNLTYLTDIQEKDGKELLSFMRWIIKLRSKGYTVIFIHHETKSTETSSGSNVKERPIDCSIRVSEPAEDERIASLSQDDTQIVIEIKKLRRWASYDLKKKFIASCSKTTGQWNYHEYAKQTKSMKALSYWLGEGKESWDESMKDHDEFSISKSQFYKTKKQFNKKENNNEQQEHHF